MKLPFLLSILSILLLSCCSVKENPNNEKKITGIIYVTGNVPFSKLTLKTDNDSTYYLKCDNKTDSILYNNQGTKVEIKYNNIIDSAGIKILKVINAKLEVK